MERTKFSHDRFADQVWAQRDLMRLAIARVSCVDADDALSTALMRAWQHRDRFDGRNLRAWLYRLARNVAITMARRRARELDVFDAGAEVDECGAPAAALLVEGCLDDRHAAALEAVPAEMAGVVQMFARGARYREIADELGIPIGTVMSRLHRARRAVREAMQP